MPMGLGRFFGDMRRSTIPWITLTSRKAPLPFSTSDCRKAAGNANRVVVK